jgi:hypothetical protein
LSFFVFEKALSLLKSFRENKKRKRFNESIKLFEAGPFLQDGRAESEVNPLLKS